MMNIGIAEMMVGLVESGRVSPNEIEDADHGVTSGPKHYLRRIANRLLAGLEGRIERRFLQNEVHRLSALSPHLLSDIGLDEDAKPLEETVAIPAVQTPEPAPALIDFGIINDGVFASIDLREGLGRAPRVIRPATQQPQPAA